MQLRKLGSFGAQADGVDLSGPFDFEKLRSKFFEGQVLVVRGQKLTATQFLD